MLRVVVRHEPNLYAILGFAEDSECEPTLTANDSAGVSHTFYRVKSTPRWVLYHKAVSNSGAESFNPAQQ